MSRLSLNIVFFRVVRYITFLVSAQGRLSVHSPFLYPLYYSMRKASSKDSKAYNSSYLKLCSEQTIICFDEIGSRTGKIETTVGQLCKRTSHTPSERKEILALARIFGAENILELGGGIGLTSLMFAGLNDKVKVTSVEGVREIAILTRDFFKKNNILNISVENCLFEEALMQFQNEQKFFDFVLIDGNHEKNATIDIINRLFPVLKEKAIVVIDDLHYSPSMAKTWKVLLTDERFEIKWEFYKWGILMRNPDLSPSSTRLR